LARNAPSDFTPYAAQLVHEVIDHPVGVGMIHIEAIQFAIGGQVNARLTLEVKHNARRVDQRLLARQRCQPVWDEL
jgi:hypothetical protein